MPINNISVDAYLRDGCGRCEHYKTPACKVHRWTKALESVRELALASGLVEEMKWGSPCYTLDGKNVVMVAAFKEFCALQFFKGAALVDDEGVLESPGPSSRHVRFLKFRSTEDVRARRAHAQRCGGSAPRGKTGAGDQRAVRRARGIPRRFGGVIFRRRTEDCRAWHVAGRRSGHDRAGRIRR